MELKMFNHLVFNKEDAIDYGVNEAIILYHFRYWIASNKSNNSNNYKGRHWVYNTHAEMAEYFGVFTERQVRRLVDSLKRQKAILTDNFNKSGFDKTVWYTVNDLSSIAIKPSEDEEEMRLLPVSDRSAPINATAPWGQSDSSLGAIPSPPGGNTIPNRTNSPIRPEKSLQDFCKVKIDSQNPIGRKLQARQRILEEIATCEFPDVKSKLQELLNKLPVEENCVI